MEKIVDIVAPRSFADMIIKVMLLIVSFTAFDYFVGRLMMNLTEGSIAIELLTTLVIAAPFGIFVMSVMAVQRRLKEKLRYLSETDQLTGLSNRQAFMTRAAEKLSKHSNATVLMIDVDHFKAVNDKHGHFVGDISLRCVGKHLADNTRSDDLVARIGGEEFAVILLNADAKTAEWVSSRICQPIKIDVAKEFDIDTPSFDLTMSVGGVMALAGQNLTDLMRHADDALYRAKSTGRSRVVFYEPKFIEERLAS